jgi:hypothetical protein
MMVSLLPLISVAMATGPAPGDVAMFRRSAEVRLADALSDADSVDAVTADGAHRVVTFAIDRAGEAYRVIATVDDTGMVTEVAVRDAGRGSFAIGRLSWMADLMRVTVAVTRIEIDDEGEITLTTDDGQRYLAIPGRGAGANDAVEARWAAEWNNA